ncbi:hypothetical protein HHK36_011138 [Tetracentron sinense]|uniref:Uncharacterized protein n=1 Tax=Tetracentron sinense TaxID=13715 RepID=A0A834ZCX2_TETSI|nr:hypothetical protein HHK36_011138 [Tetracentron sinense]
MKMEEIAGAGNGTGDGACNGAGGDGEGGNGGGVGVGDGSGSSSRVGSGSEDRVKGPWCPEEDAILSRLVSKFGARNWSLIARGISGRSGKSCRLRWCNQLDPCVKRKPFTELVFASSAVTVFCLHVPLHVLIALLEFGYLFCSRYGGFLFDLSFTKEYSVRASAFKKCCFVSGLDFSFHEREDKFRSASCDMLEDASLDKVKASSEETLSCGDVNSFRSLEGQDVVSSLENISYQHEDNAQTKEDHCSTEAKDPPTLFRPVARVSAFSVYNPFDGPTSGSPLSRTDPVHEPSIQISKLDAGIYKLLKGVCGEPLVPPWCSHGCCAAQSGEHSQSSLLGPEFVEYKEHPPFSSHELASIATDLSNIAWLKCGLENSGASGASVSNNAAGWTVSQGAQVQMGNLELHTKNDHVRFEEGRNKLTGIVTELLSTQMARQPFALPAKVGGLS